MLLVTALNFFRCDRTIVFWVFDEDEKLVLREILVYPSIDKGGHGIRKKYIFLSYLSFLSVALTTSVITCDFNNYAEVSCGSNNNLSIVELNPKHSTILFLVMDIVLQALCHCTKFWFKQYSDHHLESVSKWVKPFKNGPSKTCKRQPLKNLKEYGLL